jgi:hypothetical protein
MINSIANYELFIKNLCFQLSQSSTLDGLYTKEKQMAPKQLKTLRCYFLNSNRDVIFLTKFCDVYKNKNMQTI